MADKNDRDRDRRDHHDRDRDLREDRRDDRRDRRDHHKDTERKPDLRTEISGRSGGKREPEFRRDGERRNEPYPRRDGPGGFKKRNQNTAPRIDKKTTCPFLLRAFPEVGKHHELSAYSNGQVPAGEISIYTWRNTTLRDLADMIRPTLKDNQDATLKFSIVFPDPKEGDWAMRVAGTVSRNQSPDDFKTLNDLEFVTGDYVDVAVISRN